MSKTSISQTDNSSEKGGNKQPFFDASGAIDGFDESVKWFRPYFEPIEEFERIARNKPSDRIDPTLPKITDGTMAAIVQEQPKRIIQQLATGIVECNDYEELAKIADVVNRELLLPMHNRMGSKLQKDWNMLSKAMTWGRSTSYTFFTTTDGKFHTDFVIPYVKDVLTEKGKVFAPDSNVSWLRSWYQKRDLKAIINREKQLEKQNKNYKSDWDLKALANLMDAGASAKPADLQTAAEREKGGDTGGFEIIHAFQKGIGAEFYSFAPRSGGEAGVALRKKINKDPRGKIPLDHEYCNIDLSNPLGRGQVELSGGVQNLIDQQMQMFQFLTTLMMAPPLKVRGNVNRNSLKFMPNAVWDMGSGQANEVEPYQVNNDSVRNFPGNYGLLKSQIYNLNSSQDNSISASDAPGQSKTQAGVQAQEAKLGVSDNYLRKQHESWAEAQMETSLNLYFAEMQKTEKIKLKGDDLKDLKNVVPEKYLDENGVLTIPFHEINDVSLRFKVDASSSQIKEDADNTEKLTQVYQIMSADPDPEIQKKKAQVLKVLIDEIGAEGTDDIFAEETDENGNKVEQAPQQDPNAILEQIMPMVQQMVQEGIKAAEKPQEDPTLSLIKALGVKFNDMPEDARQVILAQIGLDSDQATPAEEKADIELLKHLDGQEQSMKSNEMSEKQAQMQSQQTEQPSEAPVTDQLSQEEQELAEELIQRDFSDEDVEQAVTMLRSGMPLEQIISTIASKYASVPQGAVNA